MPELLKNRYNYQSIHDLAVRIKTVYPNFKIADFISDIIDSTWIQLELKARMRKIAINLGRYLPPNYEQALGIIDQVIANYPPGFHDFTLMYFPDFIEIYGQNECDWNLSMRALEKYTQCSSSEFAVRQFIINHEKRMMKQMFAWSKHENEHVRRLACEGSRPRLPWGKAIISFKTNPSPILGILEQLKTDESLYVRKSVANSLNDISKTHPNLASEIAKEWYGKNQHTDWIIKHGCRTLLKQGNKGILNIFGFSNSDFVKVIGFALKSKLVLMGTDLTFYFQFTTNKTVKLRLEYALDYQKAKGKRSRKIFQISELDLKANTQRFFTKKHSFAALSTRKYYSGTHSVTLIVNGTECGKLDFEVTVQ